MLSSTHERRPLDERNAVLDGMSAQVRRLTRLVVNLIDAGRLEAREVSPQPVQSRIDGLVDAALTTVDLGGRTLLRETTGDVPPVYTDPVLVQRVIANIVSNACRFSPKDQPVVIKSGVVGDHVEVLVVDRGPGMSVAQRDTVLAPFDHLSGEQMNAGLNLTVASGFMQLLAGSLHFEDTPGGGLTVVVELPIGAPSEPG